MKWNNSLLMIAATCVTFVLFEFIGHKFRLVRRMVGIKRPRRITENRSAKSTLNTTIEAAIFSLIVCLVVWYRNTATIF
jgi:hypothetical protein